MRRVLIRRPRSELWTSLTESGSGWLQFENWCQWWRRQGTGTGPWRVSLSRIRDKLACNLTDTVHKDRCSAGIGGCRNMSSK